VLCFLNFYPFFPVFPTVIQAPRNVSLILGSETWLHCVVDGKPKPKVEWYHEGKVEAEKWWIFVIIPPIFWIKIFHLCRKFNYNRLENNTIYISNVTLDHAGLYVCMAGNSGGFKRLESYLCVKSGVFSGFFKQKPVDFYVSYRKLIQMPKIIFHIADQTNRPSSHRLRIKRRTT